MAVDPRQAPIKEEIKSSQLTEMPSMALAAFTKALIAESDEDAEGSTKWLTVALRQEAKALDS